MNAQRQVGQFLERRGYTSKRPSAHLVKATIKLVEETAELAQLLPINGELHTLLVLVEKVAKREFDKMVAEGDGFNPPVDEWLLDDCQKEAADCQVVLFDIANALQRMEGEPFDVVTAAVEKATADVDRGVRE